MESNIATSPSEAPALPPPPPQEKTYLPLKDKIPMVASINKDKLEN